MSVNSSLLFLYCLFFSLNLINSQQSDVIIFETTINSSRTIYYQYLFAGDKYMVIENTYSGKLGNLSYVIEVTGEIKFKTFQYKLFDYIMTEPEIRYSNDYIDCPQFIPVTSKTQYIVVKIPIETVNITITSNLKFSNYLYFTAPILSVSSFSENEPIIIDYKKTFDYYYILTTLRKYYITYLSISSNFSVSKISYLKSKVVYTDEEILDISYDSFSNDNYKLENNYYNYQGKINNSDELNQYNYLILRLKMKVEKDENISLYIAKTEYQEYEVPRSSFLLIILIIVIVIIILCIILFILFKMDILKKGNKEEN
jgi:hypothetical protein